MNQLSHWARFKRHFIWGRWSWRTLPHIYRYYGGQSAFVVGKLKVLIGDW